MYPAYYSQWPNAWRRNPHVHYASDVRPEGKYTTKLPFDQLNYNGTEQAQHDPPTPNPLHTPRHTRQMLPVRPALRHLAPPSVLPRRPVPLPTATPAPSATPYVHQSASSAPQAAAPRPPPMSASNARSAPFANPLPAAPRPVLGRMPIWSRSKNRWEGDFAYEAQAPSVPTSSSAPPTGAQTVDPPAAMQTTRPPPSAYQQPQPVPHQAPSSVLPVQVAHSAPASAQTSSVSAHNPSYVAQAPTLAAEQQEPSSPAANVGGSPPSSPVESATQGRPASQLPVVSQTTTCSGAPHTNAGVVAPGDRTPSNNGHLVLDDSTSIKHSMGVCALPTLLSPWETIRSVDVTIPVSVNDLQKILRRAHNLEFASFASILPKTRRLRHWDRITLPNLERLVIDNIQASIRGVLQDLDAEQLNYLRVAYAPGAACNLWSDEQDYYMLLWDAWGLMRESPRIGRIRVSSNNEWYRDRRAAQFRKLLQEAVGAQWDVRVH
ncbi:uncharacterized protein SCHCODRAFT_02569185 [Schizophyllum commune H4-8]|nr:uncharacterized protein SCHCODRAFT_02569185 [Schizophyllum commune H4-8]KAI5896529.1 hypothetical protein SCHCODRAFT_02569185 [Schizophyllum commune H4-8]